MNHLLKSLICLLMLALPSCSTYHSATQRSVIESMSTTRAQYVPVTQGKIEYYRLGSGSPIVLIPGYVTDVSSWNRALLLGLAEHHQLIVLNIRNVGGSLIHSDSYTSQDLAHDTYQLIKTLHLHKPTIIGISMGGMIAQQLAALHPDKLGRLVLINTAIAGSQSIHPSPEVENAMLHMPTNKLRRYIVAVKLFFPPAWRIKMAYALAMDRFQPDQYTEIEPTAIMAQQRQLLMRWTQDNDTPKQLQKLRLPVLVLNGEADAVIPPENSLVLARTLRFAKLVRWKEGGHAMIYQYPQQIATAIDAFIATPNQG